MTEVERGIDTRTWTDPGWTDLPFGLRQVVLPLGNRADPHHASLVITSFAPNAELPVHSHASPFADAVVEGSMRVGDVENSRGTVRVLAPGVEYGPSVAGPDGCTLLEFYADDAGRPADMDRDALSEEFKAELAEFWRRSRAAGNQAGGPR
jgi:hypothetical protein